MEDLVSIPTSRKHEVPEMVQHSKDTVKNERMQGPPKGEHKMLEQKLLLLRMLPRNLLKKMVQTKELKKWKTFAEKELRKLVVRPRLI